MADLVGFLRELAREPFALGQCDCALAPATWWALRTGHDPAAAYRGAYHDEETCTAVLAAGGYLPRVMARQAREVGAVRVRDAPAPGDVAVLRIDGGWCGAIRAPGDLWAVKLGPGLQATRGGRVVAVWRAR